MDRTTSWLGRIGVFGVVAGVSLLLVFVGGGPAEAELGGGCPITISICNPIGAAVLAEANLMDGIGAVASVATPAVGTGIGVAGGGAAGVVTAAGWSGVPIAVGGALTIGVGGVLASKFYVPTGHTSLAVQGGDVHFNFAGGALHISPYFDPLTGVGGVSYSAAGGDWEGETSYATINTKLDTFFGALYGSWTEAVTLDFYDAAGQRVGNLYSIAMDRGAWTATPLDNYPFHTQAQRETTRVGAVRMTVTLAWLSTPPAQLVWESTEAHPVGLSGTLVTTADCVSAGGTRSFSSSVAATGAGDSAPLEWPGVSCNVGETLGHFSVDWVTPSGTQNVYSYTAPGWVTTMPVEYPGCVDGGCEVQLWKVFSGSPSLYCGVAAVGCPEWWADSGKADHFQCRYGPYTAPLGLCGTMRDPGKISPNTTLHIDPVTGVVTGTAEPIISTDPAAYVGTPVVTDPVPKPQPNPLPQPVGNPQPVPSLDTNGCQPTWGVFNPIEWVTTPIKCATTWAFVPPAGSMEAVTQQFHDGVSSKPPFSILGPAGTLVGSFVASRGNGSCSFGDFFPTLAGNQTLDCARPHTLDTVYTVEVLLIWTTALWTAGRMVAASLGNKEA